MSLALIYLLFATISDPYLAWQKSGDLATLQLSETLPSGDLRFSLSSDLIMSINVDPKDGSLVFIDGNRREICRVPLDDNDPISVSKDTDEVLRMIGKSLRIAYFPGTVLPVGKSVKP